MRKSRTPKEFYKLFSSRYLEYYQQILLALYEESSQSYSLLGLTEEECQEIIREKAAVFSTDWSREQMEGEGELPARADMPSVMLRRLADWGWLRKDYDETLNQYVLSFPDYSQMFVDVFKRLFAEDSSMERGSMLALYSHLFTYYSEEEKNNEILKSALQTSKSLQQMLAELQEGIRGYFNELSKEKTFLGIQQVLVNEINNSDSQKYAILTTTDSFYRYKEEVKELIDKNMDANEKKKQELVERSGTLEKESPAWQRNERAVNVCREAMELLFQINREFDGIERRYNKLIDQKRVFAKRAAARIRYLLTEGDTEEDRTKALVKLLNGSSRRDEILEEISARFGMSKRAQVIKDKSFARPRALAKKEFQPQAIEKTGRSTEKFGDYVVKPLYTQADIRRFREENEKDGMFQVTEQTVQNVEDLEKLLLVWQDAVECPDTVVDVKTDEDFRNAQGFGYSGFSIKRREENG